MLLLSGHEELHARELAEAVTSHNGELGLFEQPLDVLGASKVQAVNPLQERVCDEHEWRVDVREDEQPAGLQHSRDLAHPRRLISPVVKRIRAESSVEGGRPERQRTCVPLPEDESGVSLIFPPCLGNHRFRHVDSGKPSATPAPSSCFQQAAGSTTDVDHFARRPARRTERVQRGVVDGLEKHSLEEAAVIAASPSVEEPHWRQANSDLAPVQHGRHPRHVGNWLRQMFIENYRSAELVFGWSFYRQGSSGGSISSADEFFDAALAWFGDPDPRIGTAWEKGERSAKVIAHRRTLLVLDGLEPLQNPPGQQEGRLREPSLQALLRELAAFNMGLCVITTRMAVTDLADHEGTSALCRDLERLSDDAGAKVLRALGVRGRGAELQRASDEFSGHCLALTLLGSYLTDAYNGEVRRREEVSKRLARDVRRGAHARKVMESYQTWFGEGPELSVLRMLGLFDRPADQKALGALLRLPAIRGLTESLTNLDPTEWRATITSALSQRLVE